MAVAFDAHAEPGASSPTSPVTLSTGGITVGSGTNRALLCWIGLYQGTAAPTGVGVTWNGTSMTAIGTALDDRANSGWWVQLFGLTNPATGAQNLVVSATNFQGASLLEADCVSVTGADQTGGTTTFHGKVSATALNTTVSTTVTSATGELVIGQFYNSGNVATWLSTNQTNTYLNGAFNTTAGNRAAGAASVTVTGNLNTGFGNDHLIATGVAILAGSSSTPVALTGKSSIQVDAKANGKFTIVLSGQSSAELQGRAGPSLQTALSARSSVQVRSQAGLLAAAFLTARSAVKTTARLAVSLATALTAKTAVQVKATDQPLMRTALSALSSVQVKGRAGLLAAAFLTAQSAIRTTARAGVSLATSLSAKSAIQVKAKVQPTLATLLSAKTAIQVKARAAFSTTAQVFLTALSSIQVKAKVAPKLKTALSARSKIVVQATARFGAATSRVWAYIIGL